MRKSYARMTSIGLIALSAAASTGTALADNPRPATTAHAPAPAMPADLVRQVQEITEVVLEHHLDPPARQQMILSGIKALHRVAGVPTPPNLGRRVSAIATPEQLTALLKETWPRTTARPVPIKKLEEALLEGLLAPVPGGAQLMTAKERNAAEQLAANRYVGILVSLSRDEKEQRPLFHEVWQGGPAERAGVKKGDVLLEVEGVDTKGLDLREVVELTRGDEGTPVTIKVRGPKEAEVRTLTIVRGRIPADRLMQATVEGLGKQPGVGWKVRLDGPDPIGYLKLNGFGASTPHELRKLARQAESEGARALVIDLRGPGAGGTSMAVHGAVLVADSLLESGTIGRVRTVRGETTYQADPDAMLRGWPIAVLVDQATSGAAEWLAAALQDNRRATIVGRPTRGAYPVDPVDGAPAEYERGVSYEATVRSTVPVSDSRWTVSLTTGYLERGDGRPLADHAGTLIAAEPGREKPRGGVQPDRAFPLPRQALGQALLHSQMRAVRLRDQQADPSHQPADRPGPAADPILDAAVKVLHEALAKP